MSESPTTKGQGGDSSQPASAASGNGNPSDASDQQAKKTDSAPEQAKGRHAPKQARRPSPHPAGELRQAAVIVFGLWALASLVGVGLSLSSGGAISHSGHQIAIIIISAVMAILFLALFRGALGHTQGAVLVWTISLSGPIVGFLAVYLTLWLTMPAAVHRTVQVYLAIQDDDDGGPAEKVANFVIRYRRPNGATNVSGQDNYAVLQDIPWDAKELTVERIECVGYITKRQQEKAPRPWKYPIQITGDGGEITIDMVKSKTCEPSKSINGQILEFLK